MYGIAPVKPRIAAGTHKGVATATAPIELDDNSEDEDDTETISEATVRTESDQVPHFELDSPPVLPASLDPGHRNLSPQELQLSQLLRLHVDVQKRRDVEAVAPSARLLCRHILTTRSHQPAAGELLGV